MKTKSVSSAVSLLFQSLLYEMIHIHFLYGWLIGIRGEKKII